MRDLAASRKRLAAGVDKAQVTTSYPASGGYLAYRISTVEQSRYADFDLDMVGVLAVTVEY